MNTKRIVADAAALDVAAFHELERTDWKSYERVVKHLIRARCYRRWRTHREPSQKELIDVGIRPPPDRACERISKMRAGFARIDGAGLREAVNDTRARLKELRARQVARRVPRAQKEKADREARLLITRLISLAEQMRPFVLDEPPAPVSPDEAIARLHAAARKANGHE